MEVTREVSTNLKGVMLDFCKLPVWRSSAFHHFESSEIETKVTIQGAKQEKNTRFRASHFTYFVNIHRKNLCAVCYQDVHTKIPNN